MSKSDDFFFLQCGTNLTPVVSLWSFHWIRQWGQDVDCKQYLLKYIVPPWIQVKCQTEQLLVAVTFPPVVAQSFNRPWPQFSINRWFTKNTWGLLNVILGHCPFPNLSDANLADILSCVWWVFNSVTLVRYCTLNTEFISVSLDTFFVGFFSHLAQCTALLLM